MMIVAIAHTTSRHTTSTTTTGTTIAALFIASVVILTIGVFSCQKSLATKLSQQDIQLP